MTVDAVASFFRRGKMGEETLEKKMNIHYVIGDTTYPGGAGNKIIAHICNDIGAWGAGFVLAISKRWPQPRARYLEEKRRNNLVLGMVSLVQVENDLWVANMIAQRDIRSQGGIPPIRYEALRHCLATLAEHARRMNATIHMPRIGCGLAGGRWDMIEPIIAEELGDIPVFVYDQLRPGTTNRSKGAA